ncbi:hypothetical protein N185_15700 [Sinorhizobium sp. GW3]|nr:hypothetical protein N185_15700 [Sinorhizobium sp. GW3]
MFPRSVSVFIVFAAFSVANAAPDCRNKEVCAVAGGEYRIRLPPDGDIRGAYVYFHGYKSSAKLQMQQTALVDVTLAHHLAYVAVDGVDGVWSFPSGVSALRDDQAFIGNVLDDLKKRYGFAEGNTVLGGFSLGASMAWYTACLKGNKVAATVTFSGVFWNPLPKPQDCRPEIPPMIHFHGTADRTFPLAGREIGPGLHQGNTYQSIEIMRARARCKPDRIEKIKIRADSLDCEVVPDCIRGGITACIHNRGHEVPPEMLDAGLSAVGFPK